MINVLFVIGCFLLGWMAPEFANALGGGKVNVHVEANVACAIAASFIAVFIAFG